MVAAAEAAGVSDSPRASEAVLPQRFAPEAARFAQVLGAAGFGGAVDASAGVAFALADDTLFNAS